jgi:hypothetical protein
MPPMVELQTFLNGLVTDSPHLSRARNISTQADNHGRTKLTKKRPFDTPDVDGAKRLSGEGAC